MIAADSFAFLLCPSVFVFVEPQGLLGRLFSCRIAGHSQEPSFLSIVVVWIFGASWSTVFLSRLFFAVIAASQPIEVEVVALLLHFATDF